LIANGGVFYRRGGGVPVEAQQVIVCLAVIIGFIFSGVRRRFVTFLVAVPSAVVTDAVLYFQLLF
jgi:hypothetical protein